MKTYKTAEDFEDQVAKIQTRFDRIIARADTIGSKMVQDAYSELDKDQQDRVARRALAKRRELERPLIVSPGSARFN